jgi:predicted Zn finger-like uncharacterized protein
MARRAKSSFVCPSCHALYRVVGVDIDPDAAESEIACRACGNPMPAREGKFVLKYFLLRKGGRALRRRLPAN